MRKCHCKDCGDSFYIEDGIDLDGYCFEDLCSSCYEAGIERHEQRRRQIDRDWSEQGARDLDHLFAK